MTDCLSDADLRRYCGQEMSEAESGRTREHLRACLSCAAREAALLAHVENVVGNLRRAVQAGDAAAPTVVSPDSDEQDETAAGPARQPQQVRAMSPQSPHGPKGVVADLNAGESRLGLAADSIPGYEIKREIHRGGQGVVYQALQKATKRKVAI